MPYKPFNITKKYFTIGEMCAKLRESTGYIIEPSAVRFWEEGVGIYISRNRKHQRKYTEADYYRLRLIAILRLKYAFGMDSIKNLFNSKEYQAELVQFLTQNDFKIHG